MKKSLKLLLLVCAVLVVVAFTGCRKKGPMQKAGEKVDKAAQKTGDAVKDAADDTKDAVKNK
jgi:predicted small lipoprotein YifL